MLVDEKEITITGRLIKVARIKDEWYEDIEDPISLLQKIRESQLKADIFTFWQRLPDTEPKYNYYFEWDYIAATHIKSFEHWYKAQIRGSARNMIKKAQKAGVEVKVANFDDEFLRGIKDIFNETPIRQGKPFWHYGKDFETVKREFSMNIYREDIIGAYYNDELIGFIMLAHAGRYAMLTQIISKIKHRDKAPTNVLVAKAIEVCEKKNIPYLVYASWPRGSLADFKRYNGFVKTGLPRYYVPLTLKGTIALKLRLHNGLGSKLPERLLLPLLDLRKK